MADVLLHVPFKDAFNALLIYLGFISEVSVAHEDLQSSLIKKKKSSKIKEFVLSHLHVLSSDKYGQKVLFYCFTGLKVTFFSSQFAHSCIFLPVCTQQLVFYIRT